MILKPVHITQSAAKKVREIQSVKGISEEYALRVGVNKAPGCGEKSFIIGFDTPGTNDLVYKEHGISILIRKGEVLFLDGVRVDYVEGDNSGFSIEKNNK